MDTRGVGESSGAIGAALRPEEFRVVQTIQTRCSCGFEAPRLVLTPQWQLTPISTLRSVDLISPSTPELRPCIDAINYSEWNTDFAADFFNFRNFRLNGGHSATYQDELSIPTDNRMIW
ncbi:hypothetical protein R3P38DRAFT_3211552 [Favolaschia claudopus]|uniref:Uncharacterized protein n=1 Tax=Favolaschia claudopus TaxID=2862362 RepID=A0AAW0AGD3_9AGAR